MYPRVSGLLTDGAIAGAQHHAELVTSQGRIMPLLQAPFFHDHGGGSNGAKHGGDCGGGAEKEGESPGWKAGARGAAAQGTWSGVVDALSPCGSYARPN